MNDIILPSNEWDRTMRQIQHNNTLFKIKQGKDVPVVLELSRCIDCKGITKNAWQCEGCLQRNINDEDVR